MLSAQQISEFRRWGHLTVTGIFHDAEIETALDDLSAWSGQFLDSLPKEKRSWYLEQAAEGKPALRKLDNPVFHRPVFQQLAKQPRLVGMVGQLLDPSNPGARPETSTGVSVCFSQVFMKPPEVGGKKPIHQDNFYFGPDDPDATLTAWIALDDATTENGCLYYCDGHQTQVIEHVAPEDEPFNLQIPAAIADAMELTPAPVPRGGVSFHHGNTPHQSSANRSTRPRRAVAIHYLRNDAWLVRPALRYDDTMMVAVT